MTRKRFRPTPVRHNDRTKSGRKDWAIIHYVQLTPYLFIRRERLTISGPLLGYLVAHRQGRQRDSHCWYSK